MGMSTSIVGVVSADNDLYKKHAAVLTACLRADITELPAETAEFFGSKWPSEHLFDEKLEVKINIERCDEEMTEGYLVKVADIPAEVEYIKFRNSW